MRAFEAKLGLKPTLSKRYHLSLAGLGIEFGRIVYWGALSYPMAKDTQVMSLSGILQEIR